MYFPRSLSPGFRETALVEEYVSTQFLTICHDQGWLCNVFSYLVWHLLYPRTYCQKYNIDVTRMHLYQMTDWHISINFLHLISRVDVVSYVSTKAASVVFFNCGDLTLSLTKGDQLRTLKDFSRIKLQFVTNTLIFKATQRWEGSASKFSTFCTFRL